ncbi:MAG: zinc ribbon domain-containing protein [Clostridiales bacterium]|nr:zinc ribbon domain-containing protein [Clostridiales bacterium]
MEDNKKQTATDDEIFAAYNTANAETSDEQEAEPDNAESAESVENTENAETAETASPKKKKKRGIERHLYPCPHCGEQILDHFTECPKCGGEVKPRGYHVDEEKRKKVVRVFQIAGVILSVGLVALLVILAQIK